MKKLFLILSILQNSISYADEVQNNPTQNSIQSEQELNDVLKANAKKADEIQKQQNNTPEFLEILKNKGSATPTAGKNLKNLTDQDKQLSENFIDQAGANRILKENCKDELEAVCAGQEGNSKVLGMSPAIMKAIAKAYAAFGALSDNILPVSKGSGKMFNQTEDKNKSNKPNETKKNEDKGEKPNDYCKYIPAATETIATFAQMNTVNEIAKNGEISQKEFLLKAAKSHEGRSKQSQIQSLGWFGGSACYAVNVGLGNFAIDKNVLIKIAAATFLGSMYQMDVSNNKKYADQTREIANKMPVKGQCNPITENECYCSTPEYENDPQYCKEQIEQRKNPTAFSKVACMDNQLKLDPKCNCSQSNSCFDKFLENSGSTDLQIGIGNVNSPFNPLLSVAKGKLEGASTLGQSSNNLQAIAKKGLKEILEKMPTGQSLLTSEQKEMSNFYEKQGLSAQASNLLASSSIPQSAIDKAMSKTENLTKISNLDNLKAYQKNTLLEFSGGNGLGVVGNKNKNNGKNELNDFLGKISNNKNSNESNSKILEFAKKANEKVPQINRDNRAIFDIISNRYQKTKRLELNP